MIVGVLLVLLYAFVQPIFLVPDSSAYLAYARSILWDLDLDFDNDYGRFGMVEHGIGGSELAVRTDTGRRGNPFGLGAALLWLPFIGVVAVTAKLTALLGIDVATDGFGTATLWAVQLATWSYLLASLALVLRILTDFLGALDAGVRRAAVIGAYLGAPLVYYVLQAPSYSHACSVFVTAILLYLGLRWKGDWIRRRAVILGVVVGFAGLVRTQDIVFWIVPLILNWKGNVRELIGTRWSLVGWYTVGAIVGFAPQLAAWTVIYGSPWHLPQGEGFLHVGIVRLLNVFFSTRHGLFVWSPVFILAVTGWMMALRKSEHRAMGAACLIALGLQWFVNALPSDWWAGWSFGARRFIDFVPFVAVGLVVFSQLGRVARSVVYFVTALNLVQWLRISSGGISGETDPGWDVLWGSGFFSSLARAPHALWTVLQESPADIQVIRRPTAVPPTFHSDPPVFFDVMFVVWGILVLAVAYKTRRWWGRSTMTPRG